MSRAFDCKKTTFSGSRVREAVNEWYVGGGLLETGGCEEVMEVTLADT